MRVNGAVPVNVAVTVVQAPAHTLGLAAENTTVGRGCQMTETALDISKQGSLISKFPFGNNGPAITA